MDDSFLYYAPGLVICEGLYLIGMISYFLIHPSTINKISIAIAKVSIYNKHMSMRVW